MNNSKLARELGINIQTLVYRKKKWLSLTDYHWWNNKKNPEWYEYPEPKAKYITYIKRIQRWFTFEKAISTEKFFVGNIKK